MSSQIKLVILESPYRGADDAEQQRNITYAKRALRDSIDRGESPLASHLLYTQVLNDNMELERGIGIAAGLAWLKVAEYQVVYYDYGVSEGMKKAMAIAEDLGIHVHMRSIGKNP